MQHSTQPAGASAHASGFGASSSAPAPNLGTALLPGPDSYAHAVAHLGTEEDVSVDMERALRVYWEEEDARALALTHAPSLEAAEVFKNANDLPLARIKRIMKSDEDVRMISAEAPVLFAKACELFISDLTVRSFAYCSEDRGKRRTLTREDVCLAVQQTDVFDFLVSVLMPGAWGRAGAGRARARVMFFFPAAAGALPLSLSPPPPP